MPYPVMPAAKTLVDTTLDYQAVYSLYFQEQLGWLIGAYIVEKNAQGNLTLRYQRLLPENFTQFQNKLDETDRQLTRILNEISIQYLFRKYGKFDEGIEQFTKTLASKAHAEFIRNAVENRLKEALRLLQNKPFYRMSRDGYPAWRPVEVITEKAKVKFHFKRDNFETTYGISVTVGGKPIQLNPPGVSNGILTNQPACVLVGTQLLHFEESIEGKKIQPFLKKSNITIPRQSEKAYFEKFLVKLVEHAEVTAEGIDIITCQDQPQFKLLIKRDNNHIYTFRLEVSYCGIALPIQRRSEIHVVLDYNPTTDHYTFTRIKRNLVLEKPVLDGFAQLRGLDKLQIYDFSLTENDALAWIGEVYGKIIGLGIAIEQDFDGEKLNFMRPVLDVQTRTLSDGRVEVFGAVIIGLDRFPLTQLKKSLQKHQNRFIMPNNEGFVLIPAEWSLHWGHILEVGLQTEQNTFILERYQAALLPNYALTAPIFEDFEQIESQPLPPNLQAELRPYQKAGFDWLCFLQKYNMGGVLADDMGLGKTVQALTLLLHEKNKGISTPSLVIVPNSLVFNWQDEAERFTPDLSILVYQGKKRTALLEHFVRYDLVITTYGTLRQDEDMLKNQPFHYVILDESQYIKNTDARTTQAVLKLQSRFRLSLTGTPIENSITDLWTQMHFLNPRLLGNKSYFEKKFVNPIEKQSSEQQAARLRNLVKPFILRRTKEMVAQDLPPRTEQTVFTPMTPSQQHLYDFTRLHYRSTFFFNPQTNTETPNPDLPQQNLQILSSLQRLRQIAIHPRLIDPKGGDSGKIEEMFGMLKEVIASGSKVLIFSQFVKLLALLRADLIKLGIPFCYLDGQTDDRQNQVKRFQNDPAVPVFLISLKAGGVGLNLTAAQYVFMLDPWWNPATESQAINRAHRIGQSQSVFVYRFITSNSIEEKIQKLQLQKAKLAQDIIKTETGFFKALNKQDLQNLFE